MPDPILHLPFYEDLRDYTMESYLQSINKKNLIRKVWGIGKISNQEAATCVAAACRLLVESEPKPMKSKSDEEIFALAKKIDNDPSKEGVGLRSGLKAIQQLGYVKNFYYADKIDEITVGLLNIGPLILGVHFYYSDLDTKKEWLTATNGIAGEHALLCYGVDIKKKYFLIANSFGPTWGSKGTIKVDYYNMNKIFMYGYAPVKL